MKNPSPAHFASPCLPQLSSLHQSLANLNSFRLGKVKLWDSVSRCKAFPCTWTNWGLILVALDEKRSQEREIHSHTHNSYCYDFKRDLVERSRGYHTSPFSLQLGHWSAQSQESMQPSFLSDCHLGSSDPLENLLGNKIVDSAIFMALLWLSFALQFTASWQDICLWMHLCGWSGGGDGGRAEYNRQLGRSPSGNWKLPDQWQWGIVSGSVI